MFRGLSREQDTVESCAKIILNLKYKDDITFQGTNQPFTTSRYIRDTINVAPEKSFHRLTQHSLNCLASMGEVKLSPHVSLVAVSFQYTKHSDAWPIRVPAMKWVGFT